MLSFFMFFIFYFFFFFFSSRRRHTRFDCDWSSDVCSSDLGLAWGIEDSRIEPYIRRGVCETQLREDAGVRGVFFAAKNMPADAAQFGKIGRASCRERVEMWGVGGGVEKKV